MWIGLTPVINFGTAKQKADLIRPVLRGEKHICLAISEPFAGSDVSGVQTTAELTPDGKVWRRFDSLARFISCSADIFVSCFISISSSMAPKSGSPIVCGVITLLPPFERERIVCQCS